MKPNTAILLSLACLSLFALPGCAGEAQTQPAPVAASDGAPKVLPASQFVGNPDAIEGYTAAKQCTDVIAKLFCYCGCDDTDGHTSVLDCFTSDHGSDCTICTGEAVMALKMKKAGKSVAEIQKCVDLTFAKLYPFAKQSPALMSYRQSRLWKPTQAEALKEHPVANAPLESILSGAKHGSCCGAIHKK